MLINDQQFIRRYNLDLALRNIVAETLLCLGTRAGDLELPLWIDAICINQDDLVEKAEQIRLMPAIYERAFTVVVLVDEVPDVADVANQVLIWLEEYELTQRNRQWAWMRPE